MRRLLPHLSALLLLALFVMALFARLLFTDSVLASGDILLYFYPYRDFAAAAFREGRIPLWNPYIFSGAPFLANPQAAVLYPLHWPLSWLPVTRQIYAGAALHAWILGLGGYVLVRRWGYGWLCGLITGTVLAGSGFFGGLIGHINQMNVAAWLPWMLVVFERRDWRVESGRSEKGRIGQTPPSANPPLSISTLPISTLFVSSAAFALLVALTLLAGHTQTAYINLFGVGVWIVVGEVVNRDWPAGIRRLRHGRIGGVGRTLRSGPLLSNLSIYALGVLLGILLCAAQLLPTLELSDLGLRSGGLSYWDATSFSLQPLNLLWTLLPSYGVVDLSVVFGVAFTEFVGYVGAIPLVLALVGLWRGRGQRAWWFGITFAGLGLFLALGRWNPFYYVLFKLVPGFDLFRTPARWLMLYTVGMAVLAGIGAWRLAIGGLGEWAMGGRRRSPVLDLFLSNLHSLILLGLIAVDLLLASLALPHTHPTAPQAVYDVRTAPAHLLTDPDRALDPAAMGRFLSLSVTAFDPGDMADWRRIYGEGDDAQLDAKAFMQLIVALKMQEILAPNLPLLWRVPAVDGFDGGVLPLQRYNQLMSLLIPPDKLVPDGRIREQLTEIPDSDLLSLLGVRYVITDKVRDLWFEGVYYDRQIGATLTQSSPVVDVDAPGTFNATTLGIIGFVEGDLPAEKQPVAVVQVFAGDELIEEIPLLAGVHLADAALDSPAAIESGAVIALRDVEAGRQEYLARLPLSRPLSPEALRFVLAGEQALTIQAVTLIDERTRTFLPLLTSDQGRFDLVHSGDVKIYEALDVRQRAYMATRVQVVSSSAEAVSLLQTDHENGQAVVEASPDLALTAGGGDAEIVSYSAERVVVRTRSDDASFLVLSDAYYPGWQATVDGTAAQVYPTNVLFRGVAVPAGEHDVVFVFAPQPWQRGVLVSGIGVILWLSLLVVGLFRRRRSALAILQSPRMML